jgi:hypothetical protein
MSEVDAWPEHWRRSGRAMSVGRGRAFSFPRFDPKDRMCQRVCICGFLRLFF